MTTEAMYYLVREMGGLGVKAQDKHFEAALEQVRKNGLKGLRRVEIRALVWSAITRGREQELDDAVEQGMTEEQLSLGAE